MLRILPFALLAFLTLLPCPTFADQANVLIYHRFNDSRHPSTNISLKDFRAHLELLSQQNFTVLPLEEVVDKLLQGISLPRRCAVITVDDAFRSFLTDGWPLLKQYGYPVTLFVSTDTVGGGDYLSWQELRGLQEAGVDIGNHSASHAYLLDRLDSENDVAWTRRVLSEISRSQQAFENQLGIVPQLFAYPYGEFSPELIALVKSTGFKAAFGQQSGVVTQRQDFFQLPRFPFGGHYTSLPEFRDKIFMKELQVRVLSPQSTIVHEKKLPTLRFLLSQEGIDPRSLRCFVSGQSDCLIRRVAGEDDLYEATTSSPFLGRRSKYTLTARDLEGKSWYWFSQLWVRP